MFFFVFPCSIFCCVSSFTVFVVQTILPVTVGAYGRFVIGLVVNRVYLIPSNNSALFEYTLAPAILLVLGFFLMRSG